MNLRFRWKTKPPAKHAGEFSRFINLIRFLGLLVVAPTDFSITSALFYENFTSVFTVHSFIRKTLWAPLASSNDCVTRKKDLYIPRRNCSMEKGTRYPIAQSFYRLYVLVCAMTVLLYFYPFREYYAIISARASAY